MSLHLSRTARLALGLAALSFSTALVLGAVSWKGGLQLKMHFENVVSDAFPRLLAVSRVERGVMTATRGMNGLFAQRIASHPEMGRAVVPMIEKGIVEAERGLRELEELARSADQERHWRDTRPQLETWLQAARAFRSVAVGGVGTRPSAALEEALWPLYLEIRAAYIPLSSSFSAMDQSAGAQVTGAAEAARAVDRQARTMVGWTLGLGTFLVAVLGALVVRAVERAIRGLREQSERLRAAVSAGRLAERADLERVAPDFRPVMAVMNATMDAYQRPTDLAREHLDRISKGDLPPAVHEHFEGDFDEIARALDRSTASVGALVSDTRGLVDAALEGRLSMRADASRHQGEFRTIVQGMNEMLDAVVRPLSAAATCVDGIARGAVPPPVSAEWKGDFTLLKSNLNGCIAAVNLLVADVDRLSRDAVEGKLSTRADASRHQGDFRRIVEGVNGTLDAVVQPIQVAAACVDGIARGAVPAEVKAGWRGDFEVLERNLNVCIRAVNALVSDANGLADAAVAGSLERRADASRHQGDFRRIVDGVNRTLDAVIAPGRDAAQVLERLAGRDLRPRVTTSYAGDHARMRNAVNATAVALHDALAQVAGAVEQVSSAATQIAASSQAVASGASQQASSLEETSASATSLSERTRRTEENARQADLLARAARGAAADGTSAVERLQGAMGRIRVSSERTSQIIKDVAEIAFQTNLLALNAAVEAARAGEAGRGFAVVAEEVRSLAKRAKEAATRTEELIQQAVGEAADGEGASREVAARLAEIGGGISKVSDIVAEIAAGAREQSAGFDQVNQAISEMDKVTQQNAASAEESSSAASELSGQAEELAAMVATFQLERGAPSRGLAARGELAAPG